MFRLDPLAILKLILLFLLLNITASVLFEFKGFSLPKLFFSLLLVISAILLIVNFYTQIRKKIEVSIYFKVVFGLLTLWTLFIILRSLSANSKDLLTLIGHHQVGALTWITPLAIVFGFNIMNWLNLFNFIENILIGGVILGISFFPFRHENGIEDWLHFLPIILLTGFYQTRRRNIIVVLSILMLIALSITSAHRTNFLYILVILSFYTIEFFIRKDISIYKKLLASVFLIILLFFGSLQVQSYYEKAMNNKGLSTDTRTFLFEELFADMNDKELIIGRGVLGTYYSPYFQYTSDHGLDGDDPNRSISEVGYLFMILKGGYVLLALYLMILLPAAYLGIFKSQNMIARMCGYYILLYLILWPISYSPTFVPKFIILWMAVGTCISPPVRKVNIKMINVDNKANQIINN